MTHRIRKIVWLFSGLGLSIWSLVANGLITRTRLADFLQGQEAQAAQDMVVQNKSVGTLASETMDGVMRNHTNTSSVDRSMEFRRRCLSSPIPAPTWEWHHFSNQTTQPMSTKRLLIATYSAHGQYGRLLELTSPINKEYARVWHHDFVVLQGTTMILPYDDDCPPPEERSRFNKIDLLLMALSRSSDYDQLLILDADTLIYDFSTDITQLLHEEFMLVAQRTHQHDPPVTDRINNGVTLWNLHHPLTATVARDWNSISRDGIPDNRPFRGDQYYLREVIASPDRVSVIWGVWDEFYYRDGTVIKHFQRSNSRSWRDTGLDTREDRIRNATLEVCQRFGLNEDQLDYRNYTTPHVPSNTFEYKDRVDPSSECAPRKKPVWALSKYATNSSAIASRRLLVAQYSSYGSYATLMEKTSPINMAYAKKWQHDMLIVQGTVLLMKADGECEPPQNRARYNKIPILLYALSLEETYDQILILDGDAMMYDFDHDVTTLLPDNEMIAAHSVKSNNTSHTLNINNGVTLWNLHHNTTKKVAKDWLQGVLRALIESTKEGGRDAHGDQHYLQRSLRDVKSAKQYVHSLKEEFRYARATRIKHFVRPKNNDWTGYGMAGRLEKIQHSINDVCSNYSIGCMETAIGLSPPIGNLTIVDWN